MNRAALKSQAAAAAPLVADYDRLARHLPGAGLPWLTDLRRRGLSVFHEFGLPNRRMEAWKYTDLSRLGDIGFAQARLADAPPLTEMPSEILDLDGHKVFLVDGSLDPEASQLDGLEDGVVVRGLAWVLERHPEWVEPHLGRMAPLDGAPMAALNAACFHDGLFVLVRRGVVMEKPLHVVSLGAAGNRAVAFHPRLLVVLEDGAQATLVESHAGLREQPYLSNGVAEIALGRGARLRHYKLQDETPNAYHVHLCAPRLADDAAYEGFTLQVGGRIARSEVRALLDGTHVRFRLDGAYLGDGEAHLDNTSFVDHLRPYGTSRQTWKGVLGGRSRGVFQGKVRVHREAQKTDAHQLSRALLLQPGAEMDGKPELEIYADDVKCGHGSTIGELDRDMLFYLESRGISADEARQLLIEGFVGACIEEISHPAVREAFLTVVRHRLRARH